MNLARFTIRTRLVATYAVLLAVSVAVAGFGIYAMSRTNDAMRKVVDVNMANISRLERMADAVHIESRVIRTIALLEDADAADQEFGKIVLARRQYSVAEQQLRAFLAGEALWNKVSEGKDLAGELNDNFLEMNKAYKHSAVKYLLSEAIPANARWLTGIEAFSSALRERNKRDQEAANAIFVGARLIMVSVVAAAVCAGMLVAWATVNSITRPIALAVRMAEDVAAGDLTTSFDATSGDEAGKLFEALKRMMSNLTGIVREMRAGAGTIAGESLRISNGNRDLSERTEKQAGSLRATALSMERLALTVRRNSDNARRADQLAQSASLVAERNGAIIGEVIDTMRSINESAKHMGDIIGEIEGIAFQTNILALNAAVEAARAGQHGRGFAVVASEVGQLAQRSATAAKAIKALISRSIEKVDRGCELVDLAGSTMGDVVGGARRVADVLGEITLASQEQASGIERVKQAIILMDESTRKNSGLVERSAASTESLSDLAKKMVDVVSALKIADTGMPDPPRRRDGGEGAGPGGPAAGR
ncbi:methyl-accepting chemotaxis protein [Pseudoduganella namucuonensis]|uniref:Methyl-accepting chemotaxis sensory transducer with TarH sensor n=1 Tax=Pseudoduganella namucuonensis TaxID=1035707 RepID=A0A1I7F1A5_9BURK|nr:methyl-accepting chemotaxis protein [Pseudoduganella namucuonensis]SFU29940.1 methyl-accepting chemotaxis sensory transducer with TarH sensor [Pseudoduganella namucuonensis]